MKKLIFALALSLLASPAFAAFTGPGTPAKSDQAPITQAAQVATAPEKTLCLLEGNIVEQTIGNRYIFKDDSGNITVKISRKQLRCRTVTPENKIRICGEVDIEKQKAEVDVDWLEILQ